MRFLDPDQYSGSQNNWEIKLLSLLALQAAEPSHGSDNHGGGVSSRRPKNGFPNWYFRAKYIDIQKSAFLFLFFSSLVWNTNESFLNLQVAYYKSSHQKTTEE